MYKIIGSDQKEYGPVDAGQIRQWIAQGRINQETLLQAEGADGWRPLREFSEFAVVTPGPSASPPPLPGRGTSPPALRAAPKTSGMAVASLVLGICGFCGITAIIGAILGVAALIRIQKSNGVLGGRGLAIAGIVVSGVMFFISIPLLAGLMLPALQKAKVRASEVRCVSHVKQLALALHLVAQENEGRLPKASEWTDEVSPHLSSQAVLHCPARPNQRISYAFNANLSGQELSTVHSSTVLLFEADGAWNQSGDESDVIGAPRHGRITVAFADGTVRSVNWGAVRELRWKP